MSRYVTRAVHQDPPYDDEPAMIPELQVDGPSEVNTGLVSAAGDAIYRIAPPIGFGRDAEW